MANGKKPGKRGVFLILVTLVVMLPIGVSFTRPEMDIPDPSTTLISSTPAASTNTPFMEIPTVTPSPIIDPSPVTPQEIIPLLNQTSVILSMMAESHYQLFIYDPLSSSFTQLTDHSWDIITPAISPDGNFLAFSSNRDGFWDLYILDVSNDALTKLTNTPQYDAAPAWSPDGKWLAYETYAENNLEIQIISTVPGDTTLIRLTEDPASDHSPAWSPDGRYLLFVSDRSGDDEIWGADLHTTQDRFANMSNRPSTVDREPNWSSDGNVLLWSSTENGSSCILRQEMGTGNPETIVTGSQPHFNPDGTTLLVINQGPSDSLISTYSMETRRITNVPSILPGMINGLTWIPGLTLNLVTESVQKMDGDVTVTKPDQTISGADNQSGDNNALLLLEDINVPYPYLVADVVDDFGTLRQQIEQLIGWNFLDNLENAFIPITQPPSPEMEDCWLYTGRAIAINTSPLYGGWMSVVREDYNGQTYWRVFLKTRFQDGSQGLPLKSKVWDFTTRNSGDAMGYENGGSLADIPEGYWVDFTALAHQFGWKRIPALQDWRSYMDGAQFNEYVQDNNLTWQAAMLELYPPEALVTATRVPTQTPTPQASQ
ncbi:MAG: DPP IV N-terminal domain-containing protein [Chloroflexi bacterium]|nr:DPP IV N-terminal domain-containing protein [Chloroflexota bacterium]